MVEFKKINFFMYLDFYSRGKKRWKILGETVQEQCCRPSLAWSQKVEREPDRPESCLPGETKHAFESDVEKSEHWKCKHQSECWNTYGQNQGERKGKKWKEEAIIRHEETSCFHHISTFFQAAV